jgi:hypothetical protein
MRKLNISGDRKSWWDFVSIEIYTAMSKREGI